MPSFENPSSPEQQENPLEEIGQYFKNHLDRITRRIHQSLETGRFSENESEMLEGDREAYRKISSRKEEMSAIIQNLDTGNYEPARAFIQSEIDDIREQIGALEPNGEFYRPQEVLDKIEQQKAEIQQQLGRYEAWVKALSPSS